MSLRPFVTALGKTRAADSCLRALPGESVSGCFEDRRDALTWLDAEYPNLIASVSSAANNRLDRLAQDLAFSLPSYLDRRGRFEDWYATSAIARGIARRTRDRHREGVALYYCGLATLKLRRFADAITELQSAVEIFQATGSRYGEGLAHTCLGLALWEVRRFTEAVTAHRQAAEIYHETEEHHGRNVGLNNFILPDSYQGSSESGDASMNYHSS